MSETRQTLEEIFSELKTVVKNSFWNNPKLFEKMSYKEAREVVEQEIGMLNHLHSTCGMYKMSGHKMAYEAWQALVEPQDFNWHIINKFARIRMYNDVAALGVVEDDLEYGRRWAAENYQSEASSNEANSKDKKDGRGEIYLYVSECQGCDECSGRLTQNCPRYAYWSVELGTGWDCPHYTGLQEDEARGLAIAKPGGSVDAAVRAADGRPRLATLKK